MALPWILIQYGTNGTIPSEPGTNFGPPPWGLIGYGTSGDFVPPVVPPVVVPPADGGAAGDIASPARRSPTRYIDGFERAKRKAARNEIKSFEELKQALDAMPRVAPEVNPEAAQPVIIEALSSLNAPTAREIEIQRALEAMRRDDEEAAIVLLLLN